MSYGQNLIYFCKVLNAINIASFGYGQLKY